MENAKLEDLKVVQANEFIQQTNWELNKIPMKIFKALIAEIDTRNPPENDTVSISKTELVKLLDDQETHHNFLKNKIRDLERTSVRVLNNQHRENYVPLVIDFTWEKEIDMVSVQFHPKVMPYLLVSTRFLQYPAADLTRFKSKYGLVLYEQLLSRQKQTGEMQFILTVEYLKWVTGTEKTNGEKPQYKQFGNWERRVLQSGVDDLNAAGVSFLVKYTKNKKGREIKSITFSCTPRMSWRDTTYEEAWAAAKMKEAQRRDPDVVIDQQLQHLDPPDQQLSLFDLDPPESSEDDNVFSETRELTEDDMPF